MLSAFYEVAPVAEYSPVIFDAFVNQTKVSPSVDLLRLEYECVFSSGGSAFML
jgi:hypothetical protein